MVAQWEIRVLDLIRQERGTFSRARPFLQADVATQDSACVKLGDEGNVALESADTFFLTNRSASHFANSKTGLESYRFQL